ncbi:tyrosine transporter TyrP [Vibrio cholerae]|uniref:aromatic amino acid transport family protein n=1 Tax=Vibrio TaxID=662 RepID=UPI000DE27AF3|nr:MULTISPECIES: aromatic amino acid transport family protein [Vibrio]MEB5521675.1 tyrosine transporter TyrP [Vibrio cholerae]MEB5529234.1 tyrosine transporter TyrP [Vibrio cholerae]RBM58348.1 tyrosine transporter TyrP [Vibrio paracholerae]
MDITKNAIPRNNSRTIGGGLIIAGTSIGAGMLSIPLVSAGIGFGISAIILLGYWCLMTYTALLMIEVHQHADSKATLHTLAKQFLGQKGKYIATLAMFFLFYSLCAAYTAGGGANLTIRLNELTGIEIPTYLGSIIFAFLVAAMVTAGTQLIDKVNRFLFGLMMLLMILVLMSLSPNITRTYLASAPMGYGLIFVALPVVFTSFGFHGSIPAIVSYLDGNSNNLKKAMYIGSCIPLIVYIFWLMCTLGVAHQDELSQITGLGAMITVLSTTLANSKLSLLIGFFADLALITSFLGVSLGLFEFIRDTTQTSIKGNRIYLAIITFMPPLSFALFYPQGFILALGYASIALVVLAIFLPVAMAYKARQLHGNKNLYRVKGGNLAMITSFLIGLAIIISQLFLN